MPKPIVFIAALLLALPAFAQTRMPAHQVEADTNMVNIAVSLPFTAQVALDWIDANWPAFSSESWSNLDPAEDTVQSVFDWVDDNWQAELDDSGWLFLDPESPTTQSVFDWIDENWPVVSSAAWTSLSPTQDTVQATFDWVDENWPVVSSAAWTSLSPTQDTAQTTFDWIDTNWMRVSTNNWANLLAPTSATVQATFDFLDEALGGENSILSNRFETLIRENTFVLVRTNPIYSGIDAHVFTELGGSGLEYSYSYGEGEVASGEFTASAAGVYRFILAVARVVTTSGALDRITLISKNDEIPPGPASYTLGSTNYCVVHGGSEELGGSGGGAWDVWMNTGDTASAYIYMEGVGTTTNNTVGPVYFSGSLVVPDE